jgi:hypothetical protein
MVRRHNCGGRDRGIGWSIERVSGFQRTLGRSKHNKLLNIPELFSTSLNDNLIGPSDNALIRLVDIDHAIFESRNKLTRGNLSPSIVPQHISTPIRNK